MRRFIALLLLLAALAACTTAPPAGPAAREASPCDAGEASYACQVERYHNVNVQ